MCIFLWRIGIWKKWNNIDRDQYFTDKLTTVHQDIVRAKLTFVRFFFVVHFLSDHCPPPKHVAEISLKLKLKSLGQNFFFWLIIRLVEEIGVRQAVSCTSQTLVWKLVNCICSWHVDILSKFRVCQKEIFWTWKCCCQSCRLPSGNNFWNLFVVSFLGCSKKCQTDIGRNAECNLKYLVIVCALGEFELKRRKMNGLIAELETMERPKRACRIRCYCYCNVQYLELNFGCFMSCLIAASTAKQFYNDIKS